jgi:hypothetical protein
MNATTTPNGIITNTTPNGKTIMLYTIKSLFKFVLIAVVASSLFTGYLSFRTMDKVNAELTAQLVASKQEIASLSEALVVAKTSLKENEVRTNALIESNAKLMFAEKATDARLTVYKAAYLEEYNKGVTVKLAETAPVKAMSNVWKRTVAMVTP